MVELVVPDPACPELTIYRGSVGVSMWPGLVLKYIAVVVESDGKVAFAKATPCSDEGETFTNRFSTHS